MGSGVAINWNIAVGMPGNHLVLFIGILNLWKGNPSENPGIFCVALSGTSKGSNFPGAPLTARVGSPTGGRRFGIASE